MVWRLPTPVYLFTRVDGRTDRSERELKMTPWTVVVACRQRCEANGGEVLYGGRAKLFGGREMTSKVIEVLPQ